ncbi:hypothetical protein GCM10017673_10090 [Streptosporangium violaceochromogenes]|nr:hypothetical protein GCM10017673_10090 [Streptosporangium violaceochromogenes]
MKDALAIHRWLLAHQVHHEIVRLPRAATSAEELPRLLAVSPAACVAVTVFEAASEVTARTEQEPVAVVASVDRPPPPAAVGTFLGVRGVRPAPAFTVNSVTDYAAGLVCPLLLPEGLTVLVDGRLAGSRRFVHTPTGERRTALLIRADHLLGLVSGKTIDLAQSRSRKARATFPLAG